MFQEREKVSRRRVKGSESYSVPLRKPSSFRCSGAKSELNTGKMMKRMSFWLFVFSSLSNNPAFLYIPTQIYL